MISTILMRMPQVEAACGLKKSAIYLRLNEGSFPKPVSLGTRHIAWRSDDIEKWISDRPKMNSFGSFEASKTKEAA